MMRSRFACITALAVAFGMAPLAGALCPGEAQAQPADDPIKNVARERFQDGVKAYDAGKYEEARQAFNQAYKLSQSPAVLLNLGLAEVKLKAYVDGGNHLTRFLREQKDIAPDQRTTAQANIEECKKNAAQVAIGVDAAGADVTIDGTSVGKSPVSDAVFVEPGTRAIVATLGGRSASSTVEAKKGQTVVATISIKPPDVGPTPLPGPTPNPNPDGGPAPLIPQPGPGPAPGPTPGPAPSGREDFGSWVTHKPLFWVGAGLTGVGLGLGIGFSIAASGSKSDAELISTDLRSKADAQGLSNSPCGPEDSDGAGDVAAFHDECNQLRDTLGIHSANVAVAAVGWVVGALSAGGTIAYVMVDWYGGKPQDEKAPPSSGVSWFFTPVVSPTVNGLVVGGRF